MLSQSCFHSLPQNLSAHHCLKSSCIGGDVIGKTDSGLGLFCSMKEKEGLSYPTCCISCISNRFCIWGVTFCGEREFLEIVLKLKGCKLLLTILFG